MGQYIQIAKRLKKTVTLSKKKKETEDIKSKQEIWEIYFIQSSKHLE